MAIGVHVLPKIPKDTTDRNRTSPFAFTGNKFEFRSLGSAASISDANVVLNTIVAESLRVFADELEKAPDFRQALHDLIVRTIRKHKRILFNGNNYADEWVQEAARRGLTRLESTVDALPSYTAEKNIALFAQHNVLSAAELRSRRDIGLDSYAKIINIEAETILMMARRQIIPSVIRYAGDLSASLLRIQEAGYAAASAGSVLHAVCSNNEKLIQAADALEQVMNGKLNDSEPVFAAAYMHDRVLPAMRELRRIADSLEQLTDKSYWPFPTYDQLLFSV